MTPEKSTVRLMLAYTRNRTLCMYFARECEGQMRAAWVQGARHYNVCLVRALRNYIP